MNGENNQNFNNQNMNGYNNQMPQQPMGPQPQYNQMPQQPVYQQPMNQPKKSGKKIFIIVGIVAVVVVILLVVLGKGSSSVSSVKAKKTLTCSQSIDMAGAVYSTKYTFKIDDEKINAIELYYDFNIESMIQKNSLTVEDSDSWAKGKISAYKSECESISGCKFSNKYSKGKSLKVTITYTGSGIDTIAGSGLAGHDADEIYNQLKTKLESQSYKCN